MLLRDYHGHSYELTNPQEAGRRFDEQIETIMPHGGCGQTITIGTGDLPVLRVDIDVDAGRAAVRWLPDGGYVADQEPDKAITVYESPDTGLVDISADLVRTTPAAARAAVVEYVVTRQRPTNVNWSEARPSS
ncbi:Imm1 family immunity protein [Micromonospora sp. C95]|nr:Imm1 family immunity protein [Micromonospora sp. C95]MBQ1022866.1 hypothetical protein [Micromonospora sp. C95]NLU78192.1 hypothetical protein [Micromonospora sp. HNM0581]